MVSLDERISYLILGIVVGFILGYITRALRRLDDKVSHVEDMMTNNDHSEEGFVKLPSVFVIWGNLQDLFVRFRVKLKTMRFRDWAILVVVLLTAFAAFQSQVAVNQTQNNAKVGCENANESRQAQLNIWNFIYATSENSAGRDQATREELKQGEQFLDELRQYTDRVFAQRDCNDLSKEYKLPPPPKLILTESGAS
jgi:hypothetical protein